MVKVVLKNGQIIIIKNGTKAEVAGMPGYQAELIVFRGTTEIGTFYLADLSGWFQED